MTCACVVCGGKRMGECDEERCVCVCGGKTRGERDEERCVCVGKRRGECKEERCVCMCVERMIEEGVPVFVCEGVWMCQWFHPIRVYRRTFNTQNTEHHSTISCKAYVCCFFFVGFFILSSTFCLQRMSCCIEEGGKKCMHRHTEKDGQADAHQWRAKWCSCIHLNLNRPGRITDTSVKTA